MPVYKDNLDKVSQKFKEHTVSRHTELDDVFFISGKVAYHFSNSRRVDLTNEFRDQGDDKLRAYLKNTLNSPYIKIELKPDHAAYLHGKYKKRKSPLSFAD
ncbi:hypothetical protein N0M98_22355 [Paenibacillus doosanensis]|uniref:hypothetical protein n=1 Tax=Paenibacillus doosanensis TaxID=1229154 RepID=UPI00217F50AA|nr:hypothetical protein [Paenibacillus doosanensis]MCS7462871.1 hypothetical protein [Paenibacillus doosanensis]